jgi:flagellar motor switch protein FliN/FliY
MANDNTPSDMDAAEQAALADWASALEEQKDATENEEDEKAPAPVDNTPDEVPDDPAWPQTPAFEQVASPSNKDSDVKPMTPEDFSNSGVPGSDNINLEMVLDVPVTISMEIGRAKIPIRNLLQLNQGSVVELDRLAGEPLNVLVNNTLIAHGEVVVVNDKFGIRLTDVISPSERIRKLK